MRGPLCIALLLAWALPASALVIEKDTTWRGRQEFAEDVRVLPGATLTVAPGANLTFKGGRLEVAGDLVAAGAEFAGTEWEGIVLKGSTGSRLADCVIRGAATGVAVQGGAPLLERLTLSGNRVGVELRGRAAGRVTGCRFAGNDKVGLFLKDDSTTAVVDCVFEGNGRFGAYVYHARPGRFAGNRFTGNAVGLMIAYHGSDPEVSGNRFEKNEVAVQVDRAARPVLRGNLLRGNRTGIYAYRRSDPLVVGNRILDNEVGLLAAFSSYPRVEGNDFDANRLAVKLEYQSSEWEARRGAQARAEESTARSAFAGQGKRSVTEEDRRATNLDGLVSARGNWWGTTGTAELEKIGVDGNPGFIHDGRDQATFVDAGEVFPLDRVDFAPWSATPLTEKNP